MSLDTWVRKLRASTSEDGVKLLKVSKRVVKILEDGLQGLDSISDSPIRKCLLNSDGFESGGAISKGVPGPCATVRGKYLDVEGSVGIFLVLGTGDQTFKRISSAYDCCVSEMEMETVVFIVQSDSEAWWRENSGKATLKNSNGNRSYESRFLDIFKRFSSWPGWCDSVSIIAISTKESSENYNQFMGVKRRLSDYEKNG
jgi:hypothetical protein